MERSGRRVLVATFVAFELAAAVLLVARDRTPRDDATSRPPTTQRLDSAVRTDVRRASEVDRLLERRARAIRTRDRAAFAATLDRRQGTFVTRQLAMFDALAGVPVVDWWYELDAADTAPPPATYYDEAWAPKVTLKYGLRGFDESPAEAVQFFTFVRHDGRWLVASDDDYARSGRRTARDVWDFGPVVTVRRAGVIALGHRGNEAFLAEVAGHAAAAVPRVTRVWGPRWSQRVVVVVPATETELRRILDDGGDLSHVAAVAVAGLRPESGAAFGNRVLVNPPNFRRLGRTGRLVVLTHEVTHVAARAVAASGLPTWLVEGFADYVGYLGTGLSPPAICQELAAEVRAGRVPEALPANHEFDGANPRLAQAYEAAWLAVRLLAERVGDVAAFYRGAATKPPDLPDGFTAHWRAYVKQTLG